MTTNDPATVQKSMTGGCLCGQIRYTLTGLPKSSGLCYCDDCQKTTGSACIAFMGYDTSNFKLEASTALKQYACVSCKGEEKVINFCGECSSKLFGGRYGVDDDHTVYAGTLDPEFRDEFKPAQAIFTSKRPQWAKLELGLEEFGTMPGM